MNRYAMSMEKVVRGMPFVKWLGKPKPNYSLLTDDIIKREYARLTNNLLIGEEHKKCVETLREMLPPNEYALSLDDFSDKHIAPLVKSMG